MARRAKAERAARGTEPADQLQLRFRHSLEAAEIEYDRRHDVAIAPSQQRSIVNAGQYVLAIGDPAPLSRWSKTSGRLSKGFELAISRLIGNPSVHIEPRCYSRAPTRSTHTHVADIIRTL